VGGFLCHELPIGLPHLRGSCRRKATDEVRRALRGVLQSYDLLLFSVGTVLLVLILFFCHAQLQLDAQPYSADNIFFL